MLVSMVVIRAAEVFGDEGCRCLPALLFSHLRRVVVEGISFGTKLCELRGWNDTGELLPILFCSDVLVFWCSTGFLQLLNGTPDVFQNRFHL